MSDGSNIQGNPVYNGTISPDLLYQQQPMNSFGLYQGSGLQMASPFYVALLAERIGDLESQLQNIFAERKTHAEYVGSELQSLRLEIERMKERDRDLIPVICSLCYQQLQTLAKKGGKTNVEQENIRDWLHTYSPSERLEQEEGQGAGS